MTKTALAMSPKILFLQQFLRHPRMVGSVIPTSRSAIRALLDEVNWGGVTCVVEYGPGTGVFTRGLLDRMPRDAKLIAIDTNPLFIAHLRATIHDARLICVEGSATDVEQIIRQNGQDAADYIISGLPFSTLPPPVATHIADATARAIRPGGAFLVYQYSKFVQPLLDRNFPRVKSRMVWRCIPPARLFWARKAAVSLADQTAIAAESLAAE